MKMDKHLNFKLRNMHHSLNSFIRVVNLALCEDLEKSIFRSLHRISSYKITKIVKIRNPYMNVYVIKLSSIILTKKHITKQNDWNQYKENCNANNCDWNKKNYRYHAVADGRRRARLCFNLVCSPSPLFFECPLNCKFPGWGKAYPT